MSEITLRRANKLRVKIELRIHELRRDLGNFNVAVSLFSPDPTAKLTERQEKISLLLGRFVAVNTALGELREQIARINVLSGVSGLLTQKATMERFRDVYRQLSGAEPTPSQEEILTLLDARKKNFQNSTAAYLSHEDVVFSVIRKDVIESATSAFEQLVADIASNEDKVEQLNATSRITLPPATEAILQSEKLI
jgi:hypothetical protein